MVSETGVTLHELSEVSGVKETTLGYWKREGLFDPTPESEGNSKKEGFRYDLQAVQTVLTIAKLRDQGASLQKIRKALDELEKYEKDLAGTVLHTDGSGVYRVRKKEDLLEDLTENPGQLTDMNMIDLGDVDEKAREFYQRKAA